MSTVFDKKTNTLIHVEPDGVQIPLGQLEAHTSDEFTTDEELKTLLSDYVKKEELPSLDNFATKDELPNTKGIEGNLVTLQAQLQVVVKDILSLKTPVVEEKATEADISAKDTDVSIRDAVITNTIRKVEVNSLQAEKVTLTSSRLNVVATDDVSISDINTTGDLPKAKSNSAMSIDTNGTVKINSGIINQTSYNGIELGLVATTVPKDVIIDNIQFNSKLQNNAILIFSHKKDAIINISNCTFKDVSNCIRISNRDNLPATINIINCTCEKWDSNELYKGFLILEDYTSTNQADAEAKKRFSNLKINFINCYGPDGKKIEGDCKTLIDNHIVYINIDKASNKQYSYNEDTKFMMPELKAE